MNNNVEFVKHSKIKHIKFIVNRIVFCNSHVHNDFEFAMLLRGKGITTINNVQYKMDPGDVVFINSGEKHSYNALPEETYKSFEEHSNETPVFLILQLSNHFLREYFNDIRNTLFKSCNIKDYIPQEYKKHALNFLLNISTIYFEAKPGFQFSLVSQIAKLLYYCYKYLPYKIVSSEEKDRLKKKNERIERIISYIEENFTSQIRLEDIAQMENITSTHVSHIFKESFGISFQDYLNAKRLEESVLLITNSDKTLMEIAYESGFSDPKYMTKMYNKYFNCSPKEFKNKTLIGNNEFSKSDSKKGELWFDDESSLNEINKFKAKYLN